MRSKVVHLSALVLPALLATGCHKKSDADPVTDPHVPITNGAVPSTLPLVDSYTVVRTDKGKPAPTDEFTGPGGSKVTLAKFSGKPFILYMWIEMFSDSVAQLPNIDALAAQGKIAVVSVNNDNTIDFPDKATPQWAALKLKTLVDYRDPKSALSKALGNPSDPVSILYDSQGRQVLQIRGTADFSSPKIQALLAEAK